MDIFDLVIIGLTYVGTMWCAGAAFSSYQHKQPMWAGVMTVAAIKAMSTIL
jgi:hypothetical protein